MPATLQRYADRQNIHAIGGVVGDLGDGLADDGRKVGLVRIEAGRVSKATVEKINRILKEMEYVPSISARMLANNTFFLDLPMS